MHVILFLKQISFNNRLIRHLIFLIIVIKNSIGIAMQYSLIDDIFKNNQLTKI